MSDWNHSLFACFDHGFGNCLYGFCLPECATASARTTYDTSDCIFNALCVNTVIGRNIIREGYGIEGTCMNDILVGYCCTPCAATQLLNETKTRGPVTAHAAADNQPWSSKLFGCMDDTSICLYTYFCPYCSNASARTKFDGSNWVLNCMCVTPGLVRNMVREAYGIEGSCMMDILWSWCCATCSICQVAREVQMRGPINRAGPGAQKMV